MREIKFRAWDKEDKKMIINPKIYYCECGCKFTHLDGIFVDDIWIYMQYTGLKDKNGKEIYEGDIVECEFYKDQPVPGEVKWDKIYDEQENMFTGKSAKLVMHGFTIWSLPREQIATAINMFPESANNIEVIGNIYENPELIK